MRDSCAPVATSRRFGLVPPRSPKSARELLNEVSVGSKRRPRVDRARELFAAGTKSFSEIRKTLVQEFGVSLEVTKDDVADMIREMAREQIELRPHQKTIALANCEAVFHAAMQAGKLAQAVRALELHAKIAGILQVEATPPAERPKLDFDRVPAEQRAQFRQTLEIAGSAQIAAVRAELPQA